MKDIDFDELDQAVNSLMSSSEEATPNPESSAIPSPVSTPQPIQTSQTGVTADVPMPTSSVNTATPAVRRAGRFMDMVHSSSDMRNRPTTIPSREGVAIAPPRSTAKQEPAVAEPASEAVESQPSETVAAPLAAETQSIVAPSVDATNMPDPLEVDVAPKTDSATEDTTTSVDVPQPDALVNQVNESPFLTDAKVEKRPLNSDPLAGTPPLVDLEAELKNDTSTDEEDKENSTQANGEDEPPAVPQVPELSSDLVAIEAGEKTESVVDATQTEESSKDDQTPQGDASKESSNKPTGPTSIAQQYKTSESTGDKTHAAIYDATEYPTPLAHPAKKKSGWLWIIWVLVLLAIGCGGAVTLYLTGVIP